MRATQLLGLALSLVLLLVGCTRTISIVDGTWAVECEGVNLDDCRGVAELFVNNLARSHESVRQESGGLVRVSSAACPSLPEWAAPGGCWRASARTTITPRACMIIARQKDPGTALAPFGQAGGDQFAGSMGRPDPGTGLC